MNPFKALFSLGKETAPTANEALIAERDGLLETLAKAEAGYNKLHADHQTAQAKITALETAAQSHAADLKAATDRAEAAEKAKTDLEAALPDRIKTEAIRLAAAQGITLADVPPPSTGGSTGDEAELKAAITAMRAERDPVKKGKLLARVDELRKAAA